MPEIELAERDRPDRPTCVMCRGGLGAGDAAVDCPDCGVPLHDECWEGLKRCPTPGCAGVLSRSDRLSQELLAWGTAPAEAFEPGEPGAGVSDRPGDAWSPSLGVGRGPSLRSTRSEPGLTPGQEFLGAMLGAEALMLFALALAVTFLPSGPIMKLSLLALCVGRVPLLLGAASVENAGGLFALHALLGLVLMEAATGWASHFHVAADMPSFGLAMVAAFAGLLALAVRKLARTSGPL